MIRTDGEPTIAWADPPCCGDPGDCIGCSESIALEEAAAELAETHYFDGEGNSAPLDEVLS